MVECFGGKTHLGKPPHVVTNDLRVWTLELADDLEALVELGEHVHHGAGEQGVLRSHLELQVQTDREGLEDTTQRFSSPTRVVAPPKHNVHKSRTSSPCINIHQSIDPSNL